MDVITENWKMVSIWMRNSKGVSIRTHPKISTAYLVVVNTVQRIEEDVIGTFPTFEIAEEALSSLRQAHMEDRSPWDVYEFKRSLGLI